MINNEFIIENNILMNYKGNDKIVKIPENVIEIDNFAFSKKDSINTIYIPDNVKTIRSRAISECKNLKTIKLPNNLEEVETDAITKCDSLEEIQIPPNISFVGLFLTYNKNLKKITLSKDYSENDVNYIIGDNNPSLIEITGPNIITENGVIYNKDKTTLISYLESKKDEIFKIPLSVKKICQYSFSENEYIKKLYLHKDMEIIENNSINMNLIEKIIIPANIKTMDSTLLQDNESDKNIEIIIIGSKLEFEKNKVLNFLKKAKNLKFIETDELLKSGKNFREINNLMKEYIR